MQVQRSQAPVNPPSAPPRTASASPEPAFAAVHSPASTDQLTRQSVPPEHSLTTLATQAEAQATALEQAFKNSQRGNVVSRTLNTVVGKVSGHSAETQAKVTEAITAYRALPQKIEQLRQDLKKAEKDPAATERLLNQFRSELQQVETLAKTAEIQLGATQSSQKFWSGLTAEITSTLLVTGAAALATRKLGLPLNAATATAGFVLGGSTNVATHALFDSQYDVKREGLGNFLTAGISSSAMVITAKPGTSSLKRMMATQAVVASASAGAGAMAREYEQGFQAGWQKRVASGTLVGAGVGVLTGAAGTVIAGVLPQSSNALVQKGIQATAGAATGTVGAGVAGTLNEAFNGFNEGWQARVGQQMLGGAVTGAVLSFAPSLEQPATAAPEEAAASPKTPETSPTKTAASPEPSSVKAPAAPEQAPPVAAPESPEVSNPSAPHPPSESDPLPLLSYDGNEALRNFDKLVNDHFRIYDGAQKQKPQFLLDANGTPIPFKNSATPGPMPGMGYGSSTPGLIKPDGTPLNPNAYPPGYGSAPPPHLVKPDGTPLNPNTPSYGYSPPGPVLVKPDGTPLKPPSLGYGSGPSMPPPLPIPPPMNTPIQPATASGQVMPEASIPTVSYTELPKFEAKGVPTVTSDPNKTASYLYVKAQPENIAPNYNPANTVASQKVIQNLQTTTALTPNQPEVVIRQTDGSAYKPMFYPGYNLLSNIDIQMSLKASASVSSAITSHVISTATQPGVYAFSSATPKPTLMDSSSFGLPMPAPSAPLPTPPSIMDPGYGYGYGSAPPAYGAMPPLPMDPGYGYGSGMPSPTPPLIKPDGTPLFDHGMPSSPYGSSQLLNADGQPIKSDGSPYDYNSYGGPAPLALVKSDGTPIKGSLKEHIYTDIFQDTELRDKTIETFGQWTATYSASDTQKQMREAWSNIMKGQDPSTPMEHTVMDIYTTRKARWERLANTMGLDAVPKEFQLYRGVSSEFFVEAVVKAWRDTSSTDMQIPAHELSSWSLTRNTAEGFGSNPNASVVYEANVPFERTLADKFVDDGTFITSFSRENEVVVALSEKNTLTTPKDKATVKFQGKTYTYADRASLIAAWDAAQAAKPPAGSVPPNTPNQPLPGYPSPYPSTPGYPSSIPPLPVPPVGQP